MLSTLDVGRLERRRQCVVETLYDGSTRNQTHFSHTPTTRQHLTETCQNDPRPAYNREPVHPAADGWNGHGSEFSMVCFLYGRFHRQSQILVLVVRAVLPDGSDRVDDRLARQRSGRRHKHFSRWKLTVFAHMVVALTNQLGTTCTTRDSHSLINLVPPA